MPINTQDSIFDLETPPNMDIKERLIYCVNNAFRTTSYTRSCIVERMNNSIFSQKKMVSEKDLNNWFSSTVDSSMPIEYISALCWALGTIEPFNVLLEPLFYRPVDKKQELIAEHAEIEAKQKHLEALKTQIESSIFGGAK